ncbi:hypothetical protein AB0L35_22575 [Streptomyces sp. NPDC052309]|uniref:DUF1795 domain-containing protein n=1 Tax=Streptomyces griseicoloratus TaxID=2752516 RepID=A0A926LAF3_9ACTN|nr:hypothetical protein [Streptomyces griseicoloratus]MBD0423003.1 hypothetical protein [Streptomyces griseicoloratus]
MPTSLPIPIEFRLPEGWLPAARQEEAVAADVAFAAVHPRPDAGFAANITLDGEVASDEAPLEALADRAVQHLRSVADSVVVADRREVGSEDAPGVVQKLTFSATVGGMCRALVQSQVLLAMADVRDPHRRAVIRAVLTSTEGQFPEVVPEFQEFLGSIRPGGASS